MPSLSWYGGTHEVQSVDEEQAKQPIGQSKQPTSALNYLNGHPHSVVRTGSVEISP